MSDQVFKDSVSLSEVGSFSVDLAEFRIADPHVKNAGVNIRTGEDATYTVSQVYDEDLQVVGWFIAKREVVR